MKERVIVRIPNWLGDAVMSLPTLDTVDKETELIVAGRPEFAELFPGYRYQPLSGSWDWRSLAGLEAKRILLLTNSFSTAFAAKRAGIPDRVGYSMHFRTPLLTDPLTYSPDPHQIFRYAIVARAAGYPVPDALQPRLEARPPDDIPTGYVLLAPGAQYGSAKRWSGFEKLAELLAAANIETVVVGQEKECRGMSFSGRDKVRNLIGQTKIGELLRVIAGAAVVVSNDSGIAHCGRALSRPVIVIFGPTDPARTLAPGASIFRGDAFCAPCHLRVCPIDHRCMNSVLPETVLSRILGVLAS